MKKPTIRILLAFLAISMLAIGAQAFWQDSSKAGSGGDEVVELSWENLIPEDFKPAQSPLDSMSREQINKLFDGSDESKAELAEIEEMLAFAPVVDSLDGEQVRIPGYVVPLDFDGQTQMKEFLLVPYYGACIHTPPPPANQVVHVVSESTVEVGDTYDPVWAIGTLSTETTMSDLAESGYRLQIDRIEPYEG